MRAATFATVALLAVTTAAPRAQDNKSINRRALRQLARSCAPQVSPDTIEAVARAESALYPYALSINYPAQAARALGYKASNLYLARQPKSREEAVHWTRWFLNHGFTVSIGLMQINIEESRHFHIEPATLFDPCVNLSIGARILADDYAVQSHDFDGLMRSFSLYNSGSTTTGFLNGYTDSILQSAPKP